MKRFQRFAPHLVTCIVAVVLFVPFVVLPVHGFGRYISALFPFYAVILAAGSLVLARRPRQWPEFTGAFGLLIIVSLAGWFIGYQIRLFSCRRIQHRIEPIFVALDKAKAERGVYPTKLSEVPEAQSLGRSIRESHFLTDGIALEEIDTADATFYLSPDRYACVIPIEKPLPISITGFHIYRYLSQSPHWERDYIVWMIMPL